MNKAIKRTFRVRNINNATLVSNQHGEHANQSMNEAVRSGLSDVNHELADRLTAHLIDNKSAEVEITVTIKK